MIQNSGARGLALGLIVMALALTAARPARGEPPTTRPAGPAPSANTPPTPSDAGATQPADSSRARLEGLVDKLPGVKVDIKARRVEVAAEVVNPDAKWLELLACTKGSREHESILAVEARPSHVHLALIMIGLENGAPVRWDPQPDGSSKPVPATGALVKVTLLYEKEGKTIESGAGGWIIDQTTQKPMASDTWTFAGSRVGTEKGQRVYYADWSGSVLTLVNFGDDVLSAPGTLGSRDGNDHYGVNTAVVPAKGTKVTIRLEPAEPVHEKKPVHKPDGAAQTKPVEK